ncbi:MAG: efflux RND transporter periplasmic adaptor subunit [Bacteroidota bacterium]
MKYTLSILAAIVLLIACGQPTTTNDLASKQKLLKDKKTALRTLKAEIDQLQTEIDQLDTTREVRTRRLVSVAPVEKEDFSRFVEIQAAVESSDAVSASSETGGRIVQLTVDEGDAVRKGQLIAKLDMESVDKQIAELETSLELANTVFERQARLWKQNIGSEIQYLEAKNGKERLEKSLETIKFQLTKANVYAPITGVVDQVMVENGEVTSPGIPILQILNTHRVKVVANVPEKYLSVVKKGAKVGIKFPALDESQNARVSMIGRTINPANRTFEVEVELNNPKGILKPNLLALMVLKDFEQKDVVTVPLELVQQEVSGKDYVFIRLEAEEGPIAKKIYVETGESYEGKIIIKNGLEGGEQLIVDGARGLAENELIEVNSTKAANNG